MGFHAVAEIMNFLANFLGAEIGNFMTCFFHSGSNTIADSFFIIVLRVFVIHFVPSFRMLLPMDLQTPCNLSDTWQNYS